MLILSLFWSFRVLELCTTAADGAGIIHSCETAYRCVSTYRHVRS